MSDASIRLGLVLLTMTNPVGLIAALLFVYWILALGGFLTLLALCDAHLNAPLLRIGDYLFKWVTGTSRFKKRGVVMLLRTVICKVMDVLECTIVL